MAFWIAISNSSGNKSNSQMRYHPIQKLLYSKGNNKQSEEKLKGWKKSLPAAHLTENISRIYKELKNTKHKKNR